MADISDSAARAARDLRVVFSRLRRRIREVAQDADLSPSQEFGAHPGRQARRGHGQRARRRRGVRPQSMATTLAALEGTG